jgi:hydrogenase large subunit
VATTLALEPMTRVGGALGVHASTDGRAITDARVAGTYFRGYETVIDDRDPRDCMALASRACGWCGGVHQTTASIALEMAWGLRTPPMAQALRSVAQATEMIWVHAAHLAVRAGPDYSADAIRATTPWVWEAATRTAAPNARAPATAPWGSSWKP